MKKVLCVLMCCTLLTACADDKRYAPKEGRISLSPESAITTATTKVKLEKNQPVAEWKHVFQNTQNNQPNTIFSSEGNPTWITDIGESYTESNLPETPVISFNGMLYALNGNFDLTCIDSKDGHEIWHKKLSDTKQIPVGLMMGENNIFAVSEQGDIVAISPNGEILWEKSLNTTLRTTPTGNKKLLFVLSSKNVLLALDQKTGKEIWRYQTTNSGTFLRGMAHPALSKDILVVPFTTGEVIAFDSSSGMVRWGQMMIGNQLTDLHELPHILAAPVIEENTVYLAGNANLIGAYDLYSGQTKWTHNIGSLITPIVSGNAVFFITKNHHLMALDSKTGRVFWDKDMPHISKTTWTKLQLENTKLLVSDTNTTYIVNAETGDISSQKDKDDLISTPITVGNSIIGINMRAKLKLYTKGDK